MSKFKKLMRKHNKGPDNLLDRSKAALERTNELLSSTKPASSTPKSSKNSEEGSKDSMRPRTIETYSVGARELTRKVTTTASKSSTEDEFDDLFAIEPEVDPLDDLFAINPIDPPYPVSNIGRAARSGLNQLNVTIEYDPTRISGYSELMMECISSRGIIPADFDGNKALGHYRSLGKLEARTLARDEDRWQLFIFSAEYLRLHDPEKWSEAIIHGGKVNPDWDETKENVEQDGRTIGSIDIDPIVGPSLPVEGDFGVSHLPVREQIDAKQNKLVEENRPKAVPAKSEREQEIEARDRLWDIALEHAKKPRVEWENKVDWMTEKRIKYCYHWLREVGELPKPFPPNSLEIFWPLPSIHDPSNKEGRQRRWDITGKVMDYWRKSVEKNGAGINLTSTSYRVALTAMALATAIEEYVKAGVRVNMEMEVQDKAEEIAVQKAAKAYFLAHFPVKDLGAGPGPLSTLDPTYPEYIRLCRQYGIQIGTLLHEAKL